MTATMPGLAQFKQMTRATWAAGDYGVIAKSDLWEMGARLVARMGIAPGETVLDVACGTGNAAIRAAQAGGRVTGLDLTPELFATGRSEAAAAGVELDWVEGDAEALLFPDASFDVVLSTFGSMFSPRHEVTARELARVLRPGGRLGLFNWTGNSGPGRMFQALAGFLPPPPDFAQAPILWGNEDHVRALFAGTDVELAFDREFAPNPVGRFATVDERIDYYASTFGPLIQLKRFTEAQGRWPELRALLTGLYAETEANGEYLVVLGRKGAPHTR